MPNEVEGKYLESFVLLTRVIRFQLAINGTAWSPVVDNYHCYLHNAHFLSAELPIVVVIALN
jgi:hypothetical protein